MLKSYDELRQIDVTPYCEERDGKLYLNWAKCVALLREHGAEQAYFEPIPDPRTGSSLRMTEKEFADKNGVVNKCYETRIKVVIDDKEYIMQSPVMNGNNPVKDNSMSQQRVWNSMCRSFVKCVAIHTGLGFGLWLKSEMGEFQNHIPTEQQKASSAKITTLKELQKKHRLNLTKWIEQNGKTWETLTEEDAGMMLHKLKERYGDE